jgi:exodeoxyribonuclease X
MTLIRVIDFETTSIPTKDRPAGVIEVGACDVVLSQNYGEYRVVESSAWSELCNPNIKIEPEAQAVHHIDVSDLEGKLNPTALFLRLGEGGVTHFAAHNMDFEAQFFGGGERPMICTLKAAYRAFPEAPSHKNMVLRYHLGLKLDRAKADLAHRAGPDAYVTAHLLCAILNSGKASLDDVVRWASGPALLPRVTFGKHFGVAWGDVPSDYLHWCVAQKDMDRSVRATAKHHLKMREIERGAA